MLKQLQTEELPGFVPEVGRWMWAMESVRERTLDSVHDLDRPLLDWEGESGQENTIGSMLYHIALVEMSWLFEDVLLQTIPPSVAAELSYPMASQGRLSHVTGVSLGQHLERLKRTRSVFLDAFRGMSIEEWARIRKPVGVEYEVTPAWVVFHLVEHEAGHAAQIRAVRARAGRLQAGPT